MAFHFLPERWSAVGRGDDGGGADARCVIDERGEVVREVDAGGEAADGWHVSCGAVGDVVVVEVEGRTIVQSRPLSATMVSMWRRSS